MLSLPHGQGARTSLVGFFVNMRKPPWQRVPRRLCLRFYTLYTIFSVLKTKQWTWQWKMLSNVTLSAIVCRCYATHVLKSPHKVGISIEAT